MNNEHYKSGKVDPLDICDALTKIERSFNIKLDNESLMAANTYGKLYDLIINKINLDHSDSCTTQQAFYKLRCAIATVTEIDKCAIKPQTRLSSIFPRESRLRVIAEIEDELGFKIDLLKSKQWILALFALTLLASFAGLFYNWQIGAAAFLASVAGLKLAGKFGKEMHLKTIGDLAAKISRESYMKSRRNSCTINKNEVEQKVRELFDNDMGLQPVILTRKARF